jgi:gliding motility-associated lipoprotein GldD
MKRRRELPILLAGMLLSASCTPDAIPKPKGYFRIDLPTEHFLPYTSTCPFSGEAPAYALMARSRSDSTAHGDTACWVSMRFPHQNGTVYMTYRHVANDLPELIRDAHAFKSKHEVKAARIRNERVMRREARVFGSIFDVEGDVASPLVFYVTDSTTHFLYGALYFDARPNADSLAPVTDRIRTDVRHFVNTLSWR